MTEAPILRHYDPYLPTCVEVDASIGVIGGVLSQLHPDKFWHPVAFFSKTMDQTQQNYEIHDRELLAIVYALKEWRPELEGLRNTDEFDILSDHEPLKYF